MKKYLISLFAAFLLGLSALAQAPVMCLNHRFAHNRHEVYCAEKKVGNL